MQNMEKNKNLLVERFKYRLVYTSCSMLSQRGQLGVLPRDSPRDLPRRSPIFDWLVQYHVRENLPRYLDHLSLQGKPVTNGRENSTTQGCLILENGETLVSKLQREKIVLDHRPPQFQPATTYPQLAQFLEQHQDADGAFFYDGKHQRLARVARYTNNNPAIERVRKRQTSLLPADFFFYGHSASALTEEELDRHSGTKTDLAMVLPVAYTSLDCRVHAYQIKRTAYADSGLGKVTHFGPQGLEEEFFFREPQGRGPLVLSPYPLVGVYRLYAFEEGQLHCLLEKVVKASAEERKVA